MNAAPLTSSGINAWWWLNWTNSSLLVSEDASEVRKCFNFAPSSETRSEHPQASLYRINRHDSIRPNIQKLGCSPSGNCRSWFQLLWLWMVKLRENFSVIRFLIKFSRQAQSHVDPQRHNWWLEKRNFRHDFQLRARPRPTRLDRHLQRCRFLLRHQRSLVSRSEGYGISIRSISSCWSGKLGSIPDTQHESSGCFDRVQRSHRRQASKVLKHLQSRWKCIQQENFFDYNKN